MALLYYGNTLYELKLESKCNLKVHGSPIFSVKIQLKMQIVEVQSKSAWLSYIKKT